MKHNNELQEEIILELSEEIGGSRKEIREIVKTQFEFVKFVIEHGTFESVQLPYFGKFRVKPHRLKMLNQSKKDQYQKL